MPWVQLHTCAHWHVCTHTRMSMHTQELLHTFSTPHQCPWTPVYLCVLTLQAHTSLCTPAHTHPFHPTSTTPAIPFYPLAPEDHHASRQGGCAAPTPGVGCHRGTSPEQAEGSWQVSMSQQQPMESLVSFLVARIMYLGSCDTNIREKQVRSG